MSWRTASAILASALTCGCASKPSALTESMVAMYSTAFSGNKVMVPSARNPAYRYLFVEVLGSPISATLVLGYLESGPLGTLETWYSANNEVIKIRDGRIVATTGLQADWSAVTWTQAPPDWAKVDERVQYYERVRDAMPGYRFGIREQMAVKSTGIPQNLPISVSRPTAGTWLWFKETQASTSDVAVPDSIFAFGKIEGTAAIVYSEQCLSSTFCLRLQNWQPSE